MEDFPELRREFFQNLHGVHQGPCWSGLTWVGGRSTLQRKGVTGTAWKVLGPVGLALESCR